MTPSTRLIFMTFPQEWRGGKLKVTVLVLPRGNPLDPLVAGSPAFADASFKIAVRLIPEPGKLPNSADAMPPMDLGIVLPGSRPALFTKLAGLFNIVVAEGVVDPAPAQPPFRKFLPASFRKASGRNRPATPFGVIDDQYGCALKAATTPSAVPLPPPSADVSWGDVLQFAMRQPLLAADLGMRFEAEIDLPDGHAMRPGGWIYTELEAGGDFAAEFAADPDLTASYAARVPALGEGRYLFTPNLIAVATAPGVPPVDDNVLSELDDYADGFARTVHGTQPQTSSVTEDEKHPLPAAKDVGIQLGWDDEQILIWLNRHAMANPEAPGHTPCCVSGYRVDVRVANSGDDFTSLATVHGDIDLDGIPLGAFDGELTVETVPVQFPNNPHYWLPPYFTAWAGGSLVTTNPATVPFDGRPVAEHAPTQYTPVGADTVPLRYGTDYEFRIRLADLSGGGPPPDAVPDPGRRATTVIPFRRFLVPKVPSLQLAPGEIVLPDTASYQVLRPRLGFPEAVFTGAAGAHAALVADIGDSQAEEREPGIPDPDVTELEIRVEVRAPSGEAAPGGYQFLYTTTRSFPVVPGDPLPLDLDFTDIADLAAFPAPPAAGPVPVPTARDVRINLLPVARPRLNYYASEQHRRGIAPLVLNVRRESGDESDLFNVDAPHRHIRALFFQPDAIEEAPLRAAGLRNEAPSAIGGRLADELGLVATGLTLFARQGRRVIMGCSPALRSVLAPDKSAIQFASKDDLVRRWIVGVQAEALRDWTWDGVQPVAFQVMRTLNGVATQAGVIEIVRAVSAVALERPDRSRSYLCFFDAIDPKTADTEFPAEIEVSYRFVPVFRLAEPIGTPDWNLRLPVSTQPLQTPKLQSAGIAFSEYVKADDYSSTEPRRRRLWVEFAQTPADPKDQYYCRVLARASDPVLALPNAPPPLVREDPLPIDPEPVRVILPAQPEDENGLNAMQPLAPAEAGSTRFLVPLPPGLSEDSPELFGLFTYEFRLGHDNRRWSTARGRFGPALRVTGVQHPAPPLPCYVNRTDKLVETSAPFAEVLDGDGIDRFSLPNTEIWFLLYAQVREASATSWRNVLLKRQQGRAPQRPEDGAVRYATAGIALSDTAAVLRDLSLSPDSPLSVLAIEMLPAPLLVQVDAAAPLPHFNRYHDSLGADLGQVRILRTSPLVPVPPAC